MNILNLAQIIIGSLISIGILVAGIGYGLGKFAEGKSKYKKDNFDLFNAQIEALNKLCTEQAGQIAILQEDIKKHGNEIGRLQGVNEEKDKKIAELTATLALRNPEVTKFYEVTLPIILGIPDAMRDIKDYMQKNVISELHTQTEELKHQSEIIEQTTK